jgi:4a-hydroxytetrahydrobiopterin dehydratase
MPYAPLLSEEEIAAALASAPDWKREADSIMRTVRCPSFREAIALVDRVADAAEAADHHPDILIRWRRVTFTLSTHASGRAHQQGLRFGTPNRRPGCRLILGG